MQKKKLFWIQFQFVFVSPSLVSLSAHKVTFLGLVQFRTGPMTDGIKRCWWCMHRTMVCTTVCFIPSGFGPVRNCATFLSILFLILIFIFTDFNIIIINHLMHGFYYFLNSVFHFIRLSTHKTMERESFLNFVSKVTANTTPISHRTHVDIRWPGIQPL